MHRPSRHLTDDQVWAAVAAYADKMRRARKPIPTLERESANRIVRVSETKIERQSPRSRGRPTPIHRGTVVRAWRIISRPGGGRPGAWSLLNALFVSAFPGVVRYNEGRLWLEGDPMAVKWKVRARAKARHGATGSGRAGGESLLHRRIKEFILHDPNRALAGLRGGPFAGHDTEYLFPTGDEADVLLTDKTGQPLIVEVKPDTHAGNVAPWGQAAKYRTLYAFFKQMPENKVRVLVAAPQIPAATASRMRRDHRIESAVVHVPRRFSVKQR